MAAWEDRIWESAPEAPSRADRLGGRYQTYLPDPLLGRSLAVPAEVAARAGDVEAAVRALPLGPESASLEGLARFLLRSEAIASSRIEGMLVSAQQVAFAELAQSEQISPSRFSSTARLVANNITILRKAATELAAGPALTIEGIDSLHQALLPDERHHGLRTVQNWIGGSDFTPVGAQFIPPQPERVRELMEDLVGYAAEGVHAPLVQAALVHAQFETIHPYTDGNGRVGRALIHTVLTRRGLTPFAILPVSLVLLTRSDDYLDGLSAYRYMGDASGSSALDAVAEWLSVFLDAVDAATVQVVHFISELSELRQEWVGRLAVHRSSRGLRVTPRADSAVAKVMELLPEAPLVTTTTVRRMLDISAPAAYNAVEELAEAGIVRRKTLDRGTVGYFTPELFELVTFAERRLASTRWDTRESKPSRPAPIVPQG